MRQSSAEPRVNVRSFKWLAAFTIGLAVAWAGHDAVPDVFAERESLSSVIRLLLSAPGVWLTTHLHVPYELFGTHVVLADVLNFLLYGSLSLLVMQWWGSRGRTRND